MNKTKILVTVLMLVGLIGIPAAASEEDDIWSQETLTGGFFGLNDQLADAGLELSLGMTNIYQINARGGASTNQHAGRHQGSYDLELSADLEKLWNIQGGTLYVHTVGLWSQAVDVDTVSIGSTFGTNADAGARRSMDVVELYYEQAMFDDTLRLRIGKLDITGGFECRGCPVSFDGSAFANDETAQFLNAALVNNPTIPFPDYGLGAVLYWNPIEWWYFGAGVIDAQTDARETGFRTAFHKDDYFFYIVETGVTPQFGSANGPLQGAYRVGIWNDPQPKANSDRANADSDDVGIYLSFDQVLVKENADEEDTQGLGAFFRYGYAPSKRNDLTNFWSIGLQYQGLLDGRDDDVVGVGFAQGFYADSADATYNNDYESVVEVYYNALVTPWLSISPNIQYVTNPGGVDGVSDAVVAGVRAQITF